MCIGVTMGDPSGVGPEIILRAFADGDMPGGAIVIGDLAILEQCRDVLGLAVELHRAADPQDCPDAALSVYDMGLLTRDDLRIGEVSKESGQAALAYVEFAARCALAGELQAIVTLSLNKEATRLSHPEFSGHTGFLADLCGTERYTMMLASPRLLVTHVSTHVSLREAVAQVSRGRVHEVIALTQEAVRRLGRRGPIVVLGLNPHAGEGGAFGREEIEHIAPAVEMARSQDIDAIGPLPPDTVFAKALEGRYAAVVCMYHDQGHIPMKLVAFDEAVNVTLGLPIVRTSVDHGTAFDIAWKGIASTRSFVNACRMAEELSAAEL
jgi:4-hydroxythreonine-4-phosphate dehydrogenase